MRHFSAHDDEVVLSDRFAEAQIVDGGGGDGAAAVSSRDDAGQNVYPHGELPAEQFSVAVQVGRHYHLHLFRLRFANISSLFFHYGLRRGRPSSSSIMMGLWQNQSERFFMAEK